MLETLTPTKHYLTKLNPKKGEDEQVLLFYQGSYGGKKQPLCIQGHSHS